MHGAVLHDFGGEKDGEGAWIVARARQYSSFMVLLGNIGGAELFLPKHALMVRNKEEVRIPLSLEALPTAKEFKVRGGGGSWGW